jgi:hypothetical protein
MGGISSVHSQGDFEWIERRDQLREVDEAVPDYRGIGALSGTDRLNRGRSCSARLSPLAKYFHVGPDAAPGLAHWP